MGLQSKKVLIPSHPLINFETQRYCHNKPKFNELYSRDNLRKKVKDGALYCFVCI